MGNKEENKLTVGYVRTATKNDLSIKEQEKQIRQFCRKKGYKLSTVYSDNGYSGANLERPAFSKLWEEVNFGNAKRVVCTDPDRISGSVHDFLSVLDWFKEDGADLIFIKGNISIDTQSFTDLLHELLQSIRNLVFKSKFASDTKTVNG